MEDGDERVSSWIYGAKGMCKNVSIPTFRFVFERGNK
jgi:hypothetical protein